MGTSKPGFGDANGHAISLCRSCANQSPATALHMYTDVHDRQPAGGPSGGLQAIIYSAGSTLDGAQLTSPRLIKPSGSGAGVSVQIDVPAGAVVSGDRAYILMTAVDAAGRVTTAGFASASIDWRRTITSAVRDLNGSETLKSAHAATWLHPHIIRCGGSAGSRGRCRTGG